MDLLDSEYGASGVHVASVSVGGAVAPGTAFDPDDVAEHHWTLHNQPRQRWQHEIVHDGRDPGQRPGPSTDLSQREPA